MWKYWPWYQISFCTYYVYAMPIWILLSFSNLITILSALKVIYYQSKLLKPRSITCFNNRSLWINSCFILQKIVLEVFLWMSFNEIHDGGRYHIETSPLICSPNRWTGFYMITASVMKELTKFSTNTTMLTNWEKIVLTLFPLFCKK